MKALSVWNPWAWALVAGLKTYENRDWALPAWIRGKRVLIHSGQHKPSSGDVDQVEWAATLAGVEMPAWALRPVGGFVGSLVFDGDRSPEEAGDLWATGPRCWHVAPGSAVLFRAAIPCPGGRRFFEVPRVVAQRFGRAAT